MGGLQTRQHLIDRHKDRWEAIILIMGFEKLKESTAKSPDNRGNDRHRKSRKMEKKKKRKHAELQKVIKVNI